MSLSKILRSFGWSLLVVTLLGGCGEYEFEIPDPEVDTRFNWGDIHDPGEPFSMSEETEVRLCPRSDDSGVCPRAQGYRLPLDTNQIVNLDQHVRERGIHPVDGEAQAKLSANGFVVVPSRERFKRFNEAYEHLTDSRVPVFVTSDSVLHLYHLFFSQILKYLEITEFSSSLTGMVEALIETSRDQYQRFDGTLKEAARRNVAFLSIAAALLDPDYTVPSWVPEADQELAMIEAHAGLAPSILMNFDCPAGCDPCSGSPEYASCQSEGACTCLDYTQYIPRGHYTLTEELKRYFKAMMWLGRVGFLMRSDMETIQAVLLTDALNTSEVDGVTAAEVWYRIYRITGFLVGASDDLTFFEYQQAVQDAFGSEFEMASLTRPWEMRRLRKYLDKLREPGILGGFQSAFVDETESTKGWRFMGQRFVPDSYVLGQAVWDHIGPDLEDERIEPLLRACQAPGATCKDVLEDIELSSCICSKALDAHMPELCRLLPKGLDVMAVMGSESAVRNLAPDWDYCGFPETYKDLRKEFGAYSRDDWRQNAYWYWLDALRPLLENFPEGYPEWMRTPAWATKELNTALTSWAELRHDTILYVKQSYTSRTLTSHQVARFGSVEPVPKFYARLRDLAAYTKDGLISHGALPEAVEPHFDDLVWLLERLMQISVKELEMEELDRNDIWMIKNIGDYFDSIITGLGEAVQVEAELPDFCQSRSRGCATHSTVEGDDPYKTTLIADVHTDVNTEKVLEVGSGYLDWIIVAQQKIDGSIGASVGPVFSYYEFAHPMSDRLTVEAWNELLDSDPPARPEWIDEIRSP